MGTLTTSYSHAAPYIRIAILESAAGRLNAHTQRKQREYVGEMFGLTHALKILLSSPEGADSPTGYPPFHGINERRVLELVEEFVGGSAQMRALGFRD